MGDQTEYWRNHRPIGSIAGFYYTEELAGPHGMHFHFWLGDYAPDSREARRAVDLLQRKQDMVSWGYSRGLPERTPYGSVQRDGPPPKLIPPPFISESRLREQIREVINSLNSLDGGQNTWLASEAARLEDVLDHPDPVSGSTNAEVMEGALRVVVGLLREAAPEPSVELQHVIDRIDALLNDENKAMEFTQGFAIVAKRYHGDVLLSFHGTEDGADEVAKMTIDADPLRIARADICYAKNGNVRMWRLTPTPDGVPEHAVRPTSSASSGLEP